MPSLTIRLRDEFDRLAIDRLRAVTHEGTASKAIWRAVRGYPDALAELRAARSRIAQLEAEREDLVAAERDLSLARQRWRETIHRIARETLASARAHGLVSENTIAGATTMSTEFRRLDTGQVTCDEALADDWHCLEGATVQYRRNGPHDEFPGPWQAYGQAGCPAHTGEG